MRLALARLTLLFTMACSVPELGLKNDRLLPCPASPNCVSSLAPTTDLTHYAEPLVMHETVASTLIGLQTILKEFPRSLILEAADVYLRAQFTTLVFRFKDDVEFHIVPAERIVHIRSASRIGYYDFSTNRRRVEAIRKAWNSWLARQ